MIECVAFMLLNDQKILLEKRRLDKEIDPGLVAIPGGHCMPEETPVEALKRELEEETGLTALETHYICTLVHVTKEIQKVHYFAIEKWKGDISVNEAENLYWLELSNIEKLDIPPDKTAINEYKRIKKTKLW
ncbi:NUDIX domain-containing protein [Paraneptunicella aestuarii]|uniref:NUDIX hydrolase n=1 Tax=Paraneptunicella aestuarii TaxID=2831148 RepID=UPI001E51700A|nr:NUDIX domain-containing protein [Paraneptunicella aestuarii]UAA37494.1 NUDIX domain-containing protein [Paraneptunicella aestuarii]